VVTVRSVVNHRTVIRHVTRVVTRRVIVRRVITHTVYAIRVIRQPKTGRFAGPPERRTPMVIPRPDAYLSLPRLGISQAPVWTARYVDDGYGGFTYDIVPHYGVTRFAYSASFGVPGTTMLYGHDDEYGSIFRYLANVRRGDTITITVGPRRFTYAVRTVSIVAPTDVSMLSASRASSTLALISCTPWWVDTERVVVIADVLSRH